MADPFQIPADVVSFADHERHAQARLSEKAWAYIAGGAADELTLARNRAAYDAIPLKGRVLADLRGGGTRLDLFGQRLEHPILLAPVAHHGLACPQAEIGTAVGAAGARATLVVSTEADCPVEEIGAAAKGNFWFQLYIQHGRAFTLALLARAERAGAKAIVVTAAAGGARREHAVQRLCRQRRALGRSGKAARRLPFEMDMAIIQMRMDLPDDHASVLGLTGCYHNLMRMWCKT